MTTLRAPSRRRFFVTAACAIAAAQQLAGCGGSSGVIDGELSDAARKSVLEKRVDLKSGTQARRETRTTGSRARDRGR